jgi:hypothetical protein
MSLSSMEQKMQTAIVRQKMSNLDEEGRLRKVLDVVLITILILQISLIYVKIPNKKLNVIRQWNYY